MRRKAIRQSEEGDVDVTPLLDIVFIMLIFFIVTATFVREDGLDVTKPPENEEEDKDDGTVIVVSIDAQDNISINRRPIDLRAVRANLERELAENPESGVVINAAKEAKTGIAIQILDQAKQADAPNVAITLQQDAE